MASTSMMVASPAMAGIASRTLGRRSVDSRPSSFLGNAVAVPRAALPVRSCRAQSIRAETPSPAKATERELKENASEAQRLGKEGGAEAKARGKEAVKDFGSSVQNTTDQWQRAGDDVVGGLKKEAQDVAKPADDLLKKTRDEGREAVAEAKDQYKNPNEYNLGNEIKGSAGKGISDNADAAKANASKAGSAVSDSAQNIGKEIVDNVSQGLSEAGSRLKGATQDAVQDTKEFFDGQGAKQRVKEGQDLVGKNIDSAKSHAKEAASDK
jgi:gas vesicle protein